ncbi:MAG: zinc-ribbon domain-containing protein [Lachnospiraceae bacterium]|nr:zinc-ribbon domain-containing protein [Lachnospiraceae bacterium]
MRISLAQWCIENNKTKLLEEWSVKINGTLTADKVSYGSEKKVGWKCKLCQKEWVATVNSRTSGSGNCPECMKKLRVQNTLQTKIRKRGSFEMVYSELLQFWDFERNEVLPKNVSSKSNRIVWWKCEYCNKSYEKSIYQFVSGSRCPDCKQKRRINTYVKKHGSLYDKAPFLVDEWNDVKNEGYTMDSITPHSNVKYWWKCRVCDREWQASASVRIKGHGCPFCSGLNATESNNLQIVAPKLASEWHPNKNGDLTPDLIKPYSSRIIWWKCTRGHEWQASISNRYQGRNCPKCSAELKTSFPEQAILFYLSKHMEVQSRNKINNWEIDIYLPEYDIGIEYDGIAYHKRLNLEEREQRKENALNEKGIRLLRIKEDNQKQLIDGDVVYFKVDQYYTNLEIGLRMLYKLLNKILSINLNSGEICIERDRQAIYSEYMSYVKADSFEEVYPELCKYWNDKKNDGLEPSMFAHMSNKIIWWKCPVCQGEWKESVINVAKGNRCPFCSGHKVLKGYNDFESQYKNIAEEWDYEKNVGQIPSDYTTGSNVKVWWKCINGHEWRATIARRVKSPSCPYCTGRHIVKKLDNVGWMKKYQLASEYYVQYGNLNIPAKYVTTEGVKLGSWIRTQRVCKKNNDLSDERIVLLEKIGMVWESKPGTKKQSL